MNPSSSAGAPTGLAEEFANTARFALYGVLANGYIRDEERGASRVLTRRHCENQDSGRASPDPAQRLITVVERAIAGRCHGSVVGGASWIC